MKHQLKEGMAAKCANAQELRSAINAIVAAGACVVYKGAIHDPNLDLMHDALVFTEDEVCRTCICNRHIRIPLHEFILRALGQWIGEPKELTLGVAKELLKESISHVLNNDCVGQRKWAAKLAEYGIK
jgi:hypothetical protein